MLKVRRVCVKVLFCHIRKKEKIAWVNHNYDRKSHKNKNDDKMSQLLDKTPICDIKK